MKHRARILLAFVLAMFPVLVSAAAPDQMRFQGYLTDEAGTPLNGSYPMAFSLYDKAAMGNLVWTENAGVEVTQGFFSAVLGGTNPLDANVFTGSDLWLGVKVGTDAEMTPRQQVSSVPYSER